MKSAELESLFVLADRANDLARDAERWERDGSEDGRNLERLKQLQRQTQELKSLLRTAWNAQRATEGSTP